MSALDSFVSPVNLSGSAEVPAPLYPHSTDVAASALIRKRAEIAGLSEARAAELSQLNCR